MRENKFRVYDNESEKLLSHEHIVKFGLFGMVFTEDERFKVMQYTGVKDKNGVEIYEGDILKIILVRNEGLSEYTTDVVWEDCSFCVKSESVDYYDTFLAAWAGDPNMTYPLFELSVIGNIYEHPELLND